MKNTYGLGKRQFRVKRWNLVLGKQRENSTIHNRLLLKAPNKLGLRYSYVFYTAYCCCQGYSSLSVQCVSCLLQGSVGTGCWFVAYATEQQGHTYYCCTFHNYYLEVALLDLFFCNFFVFIISYKYKLNNINKSSWLETTFYFF